MAKLKTQEQFVQEVFNLVGDDYTVVGQYKTALKKVKVKHNVCGFEYEVRPNDFFVNNSRCLNCSKHKTKNTGQFKKEIKILTDGEYEVLGEYINAHTKILTKHNKCGNQWLVKPNDLLHHHGCPACKEPRGEKLIRRFLTNHNIKFQKEYKFKDLYRYKTSPLRFDFAVFKEEVLQCLIEFDGMFHFSSVIKNKHMEKMSENIIITDKLKEEYCNKNNIKLIRIPYLERDNINKILEVALCQ